MTRLTVETAASLAGDLDLEIDSGRLADMAAELSHLFNKMERLDVPPGTEPAFRFAPLMLEDGHDC